MNYKSVSFWHDTLNKIENIQKIQEDKPVVDKDWILPKKGEPGTSPSLDLGSVPSQFLLDGI